MPEATAVREDSLTVRAEALLDKVRRAQGIIDNLVPLEDGKEPEAPAENPSGLTMALKRADNEMMDVVSALERMAEAVGRL